MIFTQVYPILFTILTAMCFLGEEGQLISLTIASAITICLYLYDWYNKISSFRVDIKIYVAWIFVFLTIISSAVFSTGLAYSIPYLNKYAIAFLLFIYFSNRTNKEHHKYLHKILFLWGIFISVLSLVLHFFPKIYSFIPPMNLLYKAYGHNHVVNILLFTFPTCLHMLSEKTSFVRKIGVFVILMSLIFSYSRGVLFLLAGYSIYFVLSRTDKTHRRVFSLGFIVTTTLCIYMIFSYGSASYLASLFRGVELPSKTGIIDSRIHYWKQATKSFQEHPFFGTGPGTFRLISKKYQDRDGSSSLYAHSYLLQTAAETGILGLCGVMILIFLLAASIKKKLSSQEYQQEYKNLFYGVVLTLLYSLIEINLDFSVIWVLLWVLLGVLSNTLTRSSYKPSKLLSIVMLLFISYFYTSTILAQIFKQDPVVAMRIQPYNIDPSLFTQSLNTRAIDKKLINTISTLYREDPEILMALLRLNLKSSVNEEKNILYKRIISLDPFNKKYHESYLEFLFASGKTDELYEWTHNYLKTQSPHYLKIDLKPIKDVPSEELISMKNQFMDIIHGCCGEDVSIAKIFYLLGLKQLNKTNSKTISYWSSASSILPGVAYLYIERAAYMHFNIDLNSNIEPLYQECLLKAFYEKQCTDGISKLQPPGYFYTYIMHYPPEDIYSMVDLPK